MNAYTDIDDDAGPGILSALPQILWQRRWLIIVPTVLATAGGAAAAWLIPPMYESSATVLIESPQLPSDAQVTDVIDQRIARARERVLSRKDLIRLIRANDLYTEDQRTKTLSDIVDEMRSSTSISAVPIDLGGGVRSIMQGTSTIALRISFAYPEPAKAQVVAQQYVNRFLEVDAGSQQERANTAASMLSEQQNQLANQINDIENQITKIKIDNGSVLALQGQFTGNPLADASRIDSQIAGLQADNARISAQESGNGGAIAQAESNLRILTTKYSPTHPDVIAARAQLDALRAQGGGDIGPSLANPVVAANRAQIASLQQAKSMLMSDSVRAKAAASRGPAIADQIDQLTKKAEILRDQYRAISNRAQGAELNKRIETEQKGERLTLADPPVVPDAPSRPNRPVILVGAIAAGIAFGLALTLLFELLFRPIRGSEALKMAAGQAPLAIIPDFERKPHFIIRWLEQRNRKRVGREA